MRRVYYMLLAFVFGSCATETSVDKSTILSLQDDISKEITINNVLKPMSIVQLDNSPSCALKWIKRILFFDNNFYILGGTDAAKLQVFTSDGIFIREIGRRGHGHGEYNQASGFAIDETNKKIAILDAPHKILLYDFEGNFLSEKLFKNITCWDLTWNDDEFILTENSINSSEDGYLFHVFDNDFKTERKYFKMEPYVGGMIPTISCQLQVCGKKVHYIDNATHSVYTYDKEKNEALKSYTVDLDNPMPSKNFLQYKDFAEQQRNYDFILDAVLTDKTALFTYVKERKSCVALIHLNGKSNQYGTLAWGMPPIHKADEESVYLAVTANDYLKDKNSIYPRTAKKVTHADNFLIVKCRLK